MGSGNVERSGRRLARRRVRYPVPAPLIETVRVVGMPADIRSWGDRPSENFQRSLRESIAQGRTAYGDQEPVDVLGISGGGARGAFGAGVLCGWTKQGTRPNFRMVTGVSIGAVIAPFAFLGHQYDDRLQGMVRTTTDKDLYRTRWLLPGLSRDSIADNAPLARYVGRHFDHDVLAAVAAEHAKGRRLFVLTTNLDLGRPVIWNLGAIAASGAPGSLDLFRQVIVATSAMPVFFPPSYIDVEQDGHTFDEMHVDGGVTEQLLLYGRVFAVQDVSASEGPPPRRGTYYVIRNGKFSGDYAPVEPTLRAIATRSFRGISQAQGMGDLWQAWVACGRDNFDFRLAAIPDDVDLSAGKVLDTESVGRLFDRGYEFGRAGHSWATQPPGVR